MSSLHSSPLALLCALGIGLFLYLNQQQRQQSHYAEQQAIFATAYNAAIHSYRLGMESFLTPPSTPRKPWLFFSKASMPRATSAISYGDDYTAIFLAPTNR